MRLSPKNGSQQNIGDGFLGCRKTQNARTRISRIWNNKSGMVKRGTTSLVLFNVDYLHLNFNIFNCKSNRIHIFTPVEDFSNRCWYGQGNYLSQNTLFKFVYVLFIHNLNCHQLHMYYLCFEMLYISYIINIFHFSFSCEKTSPNYLKLTFKNRNERLRKIEHDKFKPLT